MVGCHDAEGANHNSRFIDRNKVSSSVGIERIVRNVTHFRCVYVGLELKGLFPLPRTCALKDVVLKQAARLLAGSP